MGLLAKERFAVPERAHWTYSAYCALTPPDCYGYELLRGRLVVSPSPKRSHQRVVGRLFSKLQDHVLRHDLGEVYVAPFDVILDPENPDPEIVVEPDILFVSKARLDIITEKNVMGAPDLVIEILSSGGERRDLIEKAELYAASGVPHYWVFDPDARIAETFALDGDVYRKTGAFKERDSLQPVLFPGLTIRLEEIW
jgi:Uma2 family endonuclease